MSCYWRILFQKVKRIVTPLFCGRQCPTRAKYRLEKPSTYTTCHCIEFGQPFWPLLRNLSCSQDQDHVHSTYICCSYTRSMQQYVFHPPKNVLLLHWEYTQKYVRIPLNKGSKFLEIPLLKSFNCRRRDMGYAKVIHKIKRKYWKKWTSVWDIENNGYSDARLKKEKK